MEDCQGYGQGQAQRPLQLISQCPDTSVWHAQSGTSRTHFEMWCEDRRNGVIIADFAVQGTLAREILGSPSEVMTRAGVKVRRVLDRVQDVMTMLTRAGHLPSSWHMWARQPKSPLAWHRVHCDGDEVSCFCKHVLTKGAHLLAEPRPVPAWTPVDVTEVVLC